MLACARAHIWSILPNYLNMLKSMLWSAILDATSLMNSEHIYKVLLKLDKNWLSYEQNTI